MTARTAVTFGNANPQIQVNGKSVRDALQVGSC
jgi:hypothetical protein